MILSRRSKISIQELRNEVGEYFDLGIEVRPGDTVFDVGANAEIFS